jgi:DNA-directed RNA polymerase subunit H
MEADLVRIYRTLTRHFFPYRGYSAAEEPLPDDRVASLAELGYLRVSATCAGRGARRRVEVIVVAPKSKYLTSEVRDLLAGVVSPAPRELAQLILAAPQEAVEKHTMLADALAAAASADAPAVIDADPEGAGVHYDLVSHVMFVQNVPAHLYVPPHAVLSEEEAEAALAQLCARATELPRIYWNDPPAYWAGARPGQIVRITRPTENACFESLQYRFVVAGSAEPLAVTASKGRAAAD